MPSQRFGDGWWWTTDDTTGSRYRSVAPAGTRSWDFYNRRNTDSYLTIPSIYQTSSRFPEMPILKWVLPNIINVFYSCQFMTDNYHGLILLSASYQYNSKDDICAEALGRLMSLVVLTTLLELTTVRPN